MASTGSIRGEYSPDGGVQWHMSTLDLLYWAMCLAPYRLIRMTTKMAREAGPYFSFIDFMSCITAAQWPCYGPLKIKPSYIIVHYYVIS